jgi:hypothetical protein
MTLKQWQEDANLRPAWAEILTNPVALAAFDIVMQQGMAPIDPPRGVDIVQWGAMMGFKRDGYMDALQNLRNLAKIVQNKQKDPKPWTVNPKDFPEEIFADDKKPEPEK